jgi:Prokaryotic metallothionein
MRCPSCHSIIDSKAAWKNSTNRFYCSEFCADSEISVPLEQRSQKEIHDRQYLERLRRLLPLLQDLKSNRISPRSVGALQ